MEHFYMYSVILSLTVAVCFYNSLQCGFAFDDISALENNNDLRPHVPVSNLFWNDFWGTPMHKNESNKSYRPLSVLTFRLNYAFHELEPMGYHLINIVLHAVVCVILLRVYSMFVSETASFIAALLFAVHPIHTEAVTSVVGRAEMLSAIFYLSALLTYTKCTGKRAQTEWSWLLLTVALVTIAMLCKENGITMIGVCCVYEIFIAQEMTVLEGLDRLTNFLLGKSDVSRWLKHVIVRPSFLLGSAVLLLSARVRIMSYRLPSFSRGEIRTRIAPTPSRQLTYNYLLPINFGLLLFPSELCCDWTMGTIPLISSILDARNLATVTFYGALFLFVKYCLSERGKRNRAIIMCLTLMVVPFVPASNLFFPVGFVVAERILYAPSMGFCLLVALGYEILIENKKRLRYILWLGLVFVVFTHSLKAILRNKDWESSWTIFSAGAKVNKQNSKLWINLGILSEKAEKYDQAFKCFSQATRIDPRYATGHIYIGVMYDKNNFTTEAEKSYRRAISLLSETGLCFNDLNVFIHLANLISTNKSRLIEADELCQTAISYRKDYWKACICRGGLLVKMGRLEEAHQNYKAALDYEPENADVHYNLGVIQVKKGNRTAALNYFNRALTHKQNHQEALQSACLLEHWENISYDDTVKKLEERNLTNPMITYTIAGLAMNDQLFTKAEHLLKHAIHLRPNYDLALLSLAQLLTNEMNRTDEAVVYLESLLQLYPKHVNGLSLLGQINLKNRKDFAAAKENFLKIIEVQPENVKANHDLCVVYLDSGDLLRAEKCLVDVLKLAPNLEQIKSNLDKIRGMIQKEMNANDSGKVADGQDQLAN